MSRPSLKSYWGTHGPYAAAVRGLVWLVALGVLLMEWPLPGCASGGSKGRLPCLAAIRDTDALLVADPRGRILYAKNERRHCIPASTLKVLTGLAALETLGPSYKFRTEFYMDAFQNLKMKGYGDPLFLSEVLEEIAKALSRRIHRFQSLILDDSYFSPDIFIPGCNGSTNPYDAPVGAISANFNTVAFQRNRAGQIVSAEKQTPLLPFARERIRALDLRSGRYAILNNSEEAARYAGELLLYFMKKRGIACDGSIRSGRVRPEDRPLYAYQSVFSLETVVEKMMHSSSNFMANQVLLTMGAVIYGPPATLAKGVDAVMDFTREKLGLSSVTMVEGSGISRQNRLSARDMLTILKGFKPYKHLLRERDHVYYKTGSLKGIRTRVGYINDGLGEYYYFIIFFNQPHYQMNTTLDCVKKAVARQR